MSKSIFFITVLTKTTIFRTPLCWINPKYCKVLHLIEKDENNNELLSILEKDREALIFRLSKSSSAIAENGVTLMLGQKGLPSTLLKDRGAIILRLGGSSSGLAENELVECTESKGVGGEREIPDLSMHDNYFVLDVLDELFYGSDPFLQNNLGSIEERSSRWWVVSHARGPDGSDTK